MCVCVCVCVCVWVGDAKITNKYTHTSHNNRVCQTFESSSEYLHTLLSFFLFRLMSPRHTHTLSWLHESLPGLTRQRQDDVSARVHMNTQHRRHTHTHTHSRMKSTKRTFCVMDHAPAHHQVYGLNIWPRVFVLAYSPAAST